MEKTILIGGFGGQGVQTLGKLLAYTANEEEKRVTFAPAYGGEMRGGTSNCTVIVSDSQIGSPTRQMLDIVVAMNVESFQKFEGKARRAADLQQLFSHPKDRPHRHHPALSSRQRLGGGGGLRQDPQRGHVRLPVRPGGSGWPVCR